MKTEVLARIPDHVTVVAVTKSHPESAIREAVAAGLVNIGENYAQEAIAKHASLGKAGATWHFIGQLQRNKVKALAEFVDVWQSIDRIEIAQEVAKRQPNASGLIQVNLTDDPNRGGCAFDEIESILAVDGLNVTGLMAVAPLDGDARTAFRKLANAAAELDLKELSMGMSGDWEMAVEEGATMIRLGSTLFGERPRPTR